MAELEYTAEDAPALACMVHGDRVAVARLTVTGMHLCDECQGRMPGRMLTAVTVQEIEDAAVALEGVTERLTDRSLWWQIECWKE